jgi:hypothetical protein
MFLTARTATSHSAPVITTAAVKRAFAEQGIPLRYEHRLFGQHSSVTVLSSGGRPLKQTKFYVYVFRTTPDQSMTVHGSGKETQIANVLVHYGAPGSPEENAIDGAVRQLRG